MYQNTRQVCAQWAAHSKVVMVLMGTRRDEGLMKNSGAAEKKWG